jgi:hypothetical protein
MADVRQSNSRISGHDAHLPETYKLSHGLGTITEPRISSDKAVLQNGNRRENSVKALTPKSLLCCIRAQSEPNYGVGLHRPDVQQTSGPVIA